MIIREKIPRRHFLAPTPTEVYIYLALVLVMLFGSILGRIFSGQPDYFSYSEEAGGIWLLRVFNQASEFIYSHSIFDRLPDALVWGGLGLIVYLIVWYLSTVISDYKFVKAETTSYSLASGQKKTRLWEGYLARLVLRLASFSGLFIYTYNFFGKIFPFLLDKLNLSVSSEDVVQNVTYGVYYFVGTLLALHLFAILARLAFLKGRLLDE